MVVHLQSEGTCRAEQRGLLNTLEDDLMLCAWGKQPKHISFQRKVLIMHARQWECSLQNEPAKYRFYWTWKFNNQSSLKKKREQESSEGLRGRWMSLRRSVRTRWLLCLSWNHLFNESLNSSLIPRDRAVYPRCPAQWSLRPLLPRFQLSPALLSSMTHGKLHLIN